MPDALDTIAPVGHPGSAHNGALRVLDDLLQGAAAGLSSEETLVALRFARYAILRERDRYAPEAKVWEDGSFLLYRRLPHGRGGLSKKAGGKRMPSFRHKTREAAEAEAARLLVAFPESTFIVLQEVGRVKLKPNAGGSAGATEIGAGGVVIAPEPDPLPART